MCRQRNRYSNKREKSMKKILCAIDETEVSRKAEVVATQLAKALDCELCFIHVSPPDPGTTFQGAWLAVLLEKAAARDQELLRNAMNKAKELGHEKVSCLNLRSYKTASAIVGVAENEGFDHIVTGSTGREGIPRFILGSTAGGIIHKAHCPVTVIR